MCYAQTIDQADLQIALASALLFFDYRLNWIHSETLDRPGHARVGRRPDERVQLPTTWRAVRGRREIRVGDGGRPIRAADRSAMAPSRDDRDARAPARHVVEAG